MPFAGASPRILRFDHFEVDLEAGRLLKRGLRIGLREKSFQVLACLLDHPGEVVTREQLRKRLWPDDVFVDFDHNLNTAMARLREALNDSAGHPHFIETLPKRGYRFVGSVSEPAPTPPAAPVPRARLVVLPFANLSGDPGQEYFSDGMTEEMITEMARLAPESLAVIARTTAMRYKGTHKAVTRIGRELGVDYAVEGSVRREDDRIAIHVQLIRVHDQTHLWAKRYDTRLREVFGKLYEAAREIGVSIDVPKGAEERQRSAGAGKAPRDLTAYNFYIQGRHHMYKWTAECVAKAKAGFEQAIAQDPQFALAYDSLAELHWYLGFFGLAPPKETCSLGMFYALRAVEIDNTLAQTHALIGMYRKELDYNWPEVEREMQLALELDPSSPVVRLRYAVSGLMPHKRMEEAVAQIEDALRWDPLSLFTRFWLGTMLWLKGEYAQALEQSRAMIDLEPGYFLAHFICGTVHREQGRFPEAIAEMRTAVTLSGGNLLMTGWLGLALAQGGEEEESRAMAERLESLSAQMYVPPFGIAWIYLGLGEIDRAFEWLERAVEARDPMIVPIRLYTFFDAIRGDARFHGLLRKMNLDL